MKRSSFFPLLVVAILILAAGLFILLRSSPPGVNPSPQAAPSQPETLATNVTVATTPSPAASPPPGSTPLPGETILRGYGDAHFPPENDLTLMSHLMDNSLLILKSAANRPLSANEDWADLFRGKNSAHERWLPDQSVALNAQGQLVDRWKTPLFFHALGGGRYEIRSAGPDGKLWTTDDIHRSADGRFRHGSELMSSDLLEVDASKRTHRTTP